MLEQFATWLLNLIYNYGYFCLIFAMFIESTFVPLPSELILIPAGYLWYQGLLNPILIIVASLIGGLLGSYFTYWLGKKLGRSFVEKHAKYFLLNKKRIEKIDLFFKKYGASSIFFGRLVFGVRHYISFPAGFAKMRLRKFFLYTTLGAGLWSVFLILLGYYLGTQASLIAQYTTYFYIIIIAIIVFLFLFFIFRTYFEFEGIKIKKRKKKQIEI